MIDTRFFFMKVSTELVEGMSLDALNYMQPAWMHSPEFLAQYGDGWKPISHTLTPIKDGYSISIMMVKDVEVDLPS